MVESESLFAKRLTWGNVPTIRSIGILTHDFNDVIYRQLMPYNYGAVKVTAAMKNGILVPNIRRDDIISFGVQFHQKEVVWGERRVDNDMPFFHFEWIEDEKVVVEEQDVSPELFFKVLFDEPDAEVTLMKGNRQPTYYEHMLREDNYAMQLVADIHESEGELQKTGRVGKYYWMNRGFLQEALQKLADYLE